MTYNPIEQYNYIINAKENELAELKKAVEYREHELEQLQNTLKQMTVLLGPAVTE